MTDHLCSFCHGAGWLPVDRASGKLYHQEVPCPYCCPHEDGFTVHPLTMFGPFMCNRCSRQFVHSPAAG